MHFELPLALVGPLGIWELIIILVILIFIFGANRLSGIGKGLGQAIRGFKDEMRVEEKSESSESNERPRVRRTTRLRHPPPHSPSGERLAPAVCVESHIGVEGKMAGPTLSIDERAGAALGHGDRAPAATPVEPVSDRFQQPEAQVLEYRDVVAPANVLRELTEEISTLSRQVEAQARQVKAQEVLLAVVVRALYPIVDRKQIAHARQVIMNETPHMKPEGGQDLKTAVLAELDQLERFLRIAEDADDVER